MVDQTSLLTKFLPDVNVCHTVDKLVVIGKSVDRLSWDGQPGQVADPGQEWWSFPSAWQGEVPRSIREQAWKGLPTKLHSSS